MAPRQVFDSNIIKIDKDGNRVLSDYLEDGEELADSGRVTHPVVKQSTDSLSQMDETGESPAEAAGSESLQKPIDLSHSDVGGAGTIDPSILEDAGAAGVRTDDDGINRVADESAATNEGQGTGEEDSEEAASGDNSSVEGSAEGDSNDEGQSEDDTPQAPAKSDNKQAWYDYAVSKGFEGEQDSITKEALIEQYGDK
jgi:hypothetical protein